MPTKPLVAVVGATGTQGGSVLRALLASSRYRVRALTRDPIAGAAKVTPSLPPHDPADLTWVKLDLNDAPTLQAAFKDADAVFAVTSFWSKEILAYPILEEIQGKNMVDAAKYAGVKHFLWSGLVDANKATQGKYYTAHFTLKSHVTEYLRLTAGNMKWTNVMPGMYMGLWTSMMAPQRGVDGVLTWSSTIKEDAKLPLVDIADDMGKVALAVLDAGNTYNGKDVPVCAGYITPKQIADTFIHVTGIPAKYVAIPEPGTGYSTEMQEMIGLFNTAGYYDGMSVDWVNRDLGKGELVTWKQFLKKTGYRGEPAQH